MGVSGPSLLIESTDSMIYNIYYIYNIIYISENLGGGGAKGYQGAGGQMPPFAPSPLNATLTTMVVANQELKP